MIFIPLVELLIFALTIFSAVVNRGTWLGWLCTFLVFWQVWNLIRFVKEHP